MLFSSLSLTHINWHPSWRSLVVMLIVFYLCFHAISGERGVVAWFKANRELEVIGQQLQEAKTNREIYEKKVALLQSGKVDPDMLDEQSRRILGVARPDEMVVFTDPAH